MVSTQSSPLLWLAEAALPVSAGGSSKQEKRWRGPQVEAPSKRQEADPVRRKSRAVALQQSRHRLRPWLRPAVSALLRMRSRAPYRSRATRRALRLQVQRGVPVPKRQATPSVRTENNGSESWPRPSQTVAQHGPPCPPAGRVVFDLGQTALTTDILCCHAAR